MFVEFGIKDVIDILLVAVLLYNTYKVMRESGSLSIFIGVLTFIGVWVVVTQVLDMELLGSIMDKMVSVGMVVLVILFQDEIRRFLVKFGSHNRWERIKKLFTNSNEDKSEATYVTPLVLSCLNLSRTHTGALIAIQMNTTLRHIEQTGDSIDANITNRLIENIFFKNSPLHDGAIVISRHRIAAAGCILPLSHNNDIPKHLGLRHRAALGLSQESDAFVVVVSEETGNIALAHNGRLMTNLSPKDLEQILTNEIK